MGIRRNDVALLSTNQVIITTLTQPDAPERQLLWRRSAEGLYAATLDDEFAGFVSVSGLEHTVHGPHAQVLGVYPTLREARTVLEIELIATAGPPPASGNTRS